MRSLRCDSWSAKVNRMRTSFGELGTELPVFGVGTNIQGEGQAIGEA